MPSDDELIEASSLGTPGARQLRARAAQADVDAVRQQMAPTPPRVYIVYSHEDEQHRDAVLELANMLRASGIDARLDRYAEGPRRSWSHWALQQILTADFVIVVASPRWHDSADGPTGARRSRDAYKEMSYLRAFLHQDRQRWEPRILPVILPGFTVADIPEFLHPLNKDHFRVSVPTEAGATDLLHALSGTSPVPLNEVPPHKSRIFPRT